MALDESSPDALRRQALAVLSLLSLEISRSVERLDHYRTADPDGSNRSWRWPDPDMDGAWWSLSADLGGHVMVAGPRWVCDMRVWNLDAARWLVGKLREVGALSTSTEPPEFKAARERAEDEEQRISARYATGGVIEGPRDPGDDTIPAFLSRECYMPPPTREQHDAVIAKLREQYATHAAKAHGGQYGLPIGES